VPIAVDVFVRVPVPVEVFVSVLVLVAVRVKVLVTVSVALNFAAKFEAVLPGSSEESGVPQAPTSDTAATMA
jgi:hypothetical protein